jgi:putative transcriptional regulator
MPITIKLDERLRELGLSGKELAEQVGLSETQLSLFRSNKVRGIRFSTLSRLCFALNCAPGDLLGYDRQDVDMRQPLG